MAEEKYTPQAQNLMNVTIEDFEEELLEVKASDANLNVTEVKLVISFVTEKDNATFILY